MKFSTLTKPLSAAIVLASASIAAEAGVTDGVAKMVSEGTANVSFRYRFETVEQDNALDNADASTLKSRLTLKTATVNGFTALLEADNVTTIGPDEYNSFVQDEFLGTTSVVADPVGTDLNQAWVKYGFNAESSATVGRQRILHADQRFVGGVGWRQNEQTYDAATYNYAGDTFTVDYSYIWGVERIFGGSRDSVQVTSVDSDSHILLATAKVPSGKVSAYVYALDLEELAALSSITYGIGYDGTFGPVTIAASVATQSDYADSPKSYDAMFLSFEGKVAVKPVTLIAGYQLLGSDDGVAAFSTPLATLHAFQGWTDMFLATPNEGVEDLYAGISGKLGPVALAGFYHDFSSDEGSKDWGSEVGVVGTYPINQNVSVQLKYADYSADDLGVDTEKLWFSIMANF